MSVILDVLKKLDREKPSRKEQPPNIATEILSADLPRPKRRIPLNVIIVSLTAVVTAGITYVLVKESGLLTKPSPTVQPGPSGTSRQAKPAPVEVNVKKKSSPPLPVGPAEPVQKVAPTPSLRESVRETKEDAPKVVPKTEVAPEKKAIEVPKPPVESKPISAPPEEKKTSPSQNVTPAKKEIAPVEPPKKIPETPVVEPAKKPPSLTLSAIVWYEDSSMRFAIVNGLKATEGSLVEGAKVVEINRTSVRFLHNQQYFEVSISR
ncbi:MAG: hypothetical protein FJ110_07660 [Deltaproteobacteria bacterium]|nr:hypothetical protein [Deltaproteobacteria bacterium]